MYSSSQVEPLSKSRKKELAIVFIAVFSIAMLFALVTNHAWEDYYITYKPSKNLATGHGLVYTPGQRVHSFTSPFNVLIPAALSYMTGNTSDTLVLWLYRILCSLLTGAAAVLLLRIARHKSLALIPIIVLIGMFATDNKIIDYSINGQETAFMVFFIALMLHTLLVDSRSIVLKLGLSLAGLMWTRPDGFIYAGCIGLGFLLFPSGLSFTKSRKDLLVTCLKAALLAAIIYLPWILWAWFYYGSPIPHTVIAKGLASSHDFLNLLTNFILFPINIIFKRTTSVNLTFLPAYAYFGGWHNTVFQYSKLISYACALYWLVPTKNSSARAVSFAFMLSHFYLTYIAGHPSPWYIPNTAVQGIFVAANISQDALSWISADKNTPLKKVFKKAVEAISVLVVAVSLLLLVCVAYQLRIQQRVIEDGHRKQIGLWLRQNAAAKTDTVFVECLGYIGYFSELKMLDYPGLSSPEVVAARRKLKSERWDELVQELKPDWLVLRPAEIKNRFSDKTYLESHYQKVKVFDVYDKVKSYNWLPGRDYLFYDSIFIIYKRMLNESLV